MKYLIFVISFCLLVSPVFADVAYLFDDYKDTPIYLLADLNPDQLKKVRAGVVNKVAEAGFRPYMIGSDEILKIRKSGQNKIDHYYFIDFTFTNNVMRTSVSCYRKVFIEHKGKKYTDFMPTNQPDVFSAPVPDGSASLDDVVFNIRNGMDRLLEKAKKANTTK